MNRLTPQLNKLLHDKTEEQYQQFCKNLSAHDDAFLEWVLAGGELFKSRVLAVIDSLTFDESDGGAA